MSEHDPYEVLGLERSADAATIRRTFRALSRTHHPDLGGDRLIYERITVAYALLIDPAKREVYDARTAPSTRRAGESPRASAGAAASAASPARAAATGAGRTARGQRQAPQPVRVVGHSPSLSPGDAHVPLHGKPPKRGLLDRTREARLGAIRELLRLIQRDLPAARAVLGVEVPGAGRHDAVIAAGQRCVIIDVLPTPDTAHAWDGATLRIGGRVATLPNVDAAAGALERAGGVRAEGLVLLVTTPPEPFRPVIDAVGPRHAAPGPANLIRASERVCTFLAGGRDADAVDLGVLSRLLALAPHR